MALISIHFYPTFFFCNWILLIWNGFYTWAQSKFSFSSPNILVQSWQFLFYFRPITIFFLTGGWYSGTVKDWFLMSGGVRLLWDCFCWRTVNEVGWGSWFGSWHWFCPFSMFFFCFYWRTCSYFCCSWYWQTRFPPPRCCPWFVTVRSWFGESPRIPDDHDNLIYDLTFRDHEDPATECNVMWCGFCQKPTKFLTQIPPGAMRNCSEDSCLGTERDRRGRRRMLENKSMLLVMRILMMMMMSMNNLDDVDVNVKRRSPLPALPTDSGTDSRLSSPW